MATQDFLFELGTEELPPKALKTLSNALEAEALAGIKELLGKDADALLADAKVKSYAAPRRLALLIENLVTEVPASEMLVQGPPARIAYDADGNPSKALEGFARKCGAEVADLEEVNGKLSYRQSIAAKPLRTELAAIMQNALNKLPIPKRMRWGASRVEFVRPVHWLVMLFGDEVIDCELLGVKSGRKTRGHRFHYNQEIELIAATDYAVTLKETGHVVADFAERRDDIRQQVVAEGEKLGGVAQIDEDLLDEVTALNEWPVALTGRFEERFLDVPAQALISSMKEHQKYFHHEDKDGNLMPNFTTISNIVSKDPQQVIEGNEKVIRPRLADAAFFFETDKKKTLESRVDSLKTIVFQKDLGTLHQKAERISTIAQRVAANLGNDVEQAARASMLAKTDLMTDMVYEFTDLQGLMGYHYALNDGEDEAVANNIPLHNLNKGEDYFIGIFLTGAYQDVMGDMHNLFGDTHSVVVHLDHEGEIEIIEVNEGDTVEEMLTYVHLEASKFKQTYSELVNKKLPENERESVFNELVSGLNGYTYLEDF